MLALDDAALARIAIGATRVRASERGRWLQDSRPQARPATKAGHPPGTMASASAQRARDLRWRMAPRLATGDHDDRTPAHGYAATREAAMVAFAMSWRRE
jgi:hypothetical protein